MHTKILIEDKWDHFFNDVFKSEFSEKDEVSVKNDSVCGHADIRP